MNVQTYEEWSTIVGGLGKPIPKLKRPEKRRLVEFLRSDRAIGLDPSWRLRMFLAAGLPAPIQGLDSREIRHALGTNGVARFIEKLSIRHETIDATGALRSFNDDFSPEHSKPVLLSLVRLVRDKRAKKMRSTVATSAVAGLRPETAVLILRTAQRIATHVLKQDSSGLSRKQRKVQDFYSKSLMELAFVITRRCETAQVSGTALELVSSLTKELGWSNVERLIGTNNEQLSELISLPGRLIPTILSNGCLRDADFLSSRVGLIDDALKGFSTSLQVLLATKGPELPLASREWAEGFLGAKRSPDPQTVHIDSESDVNLERMATLLLASWEAQTEGERSLHLFQTLSGICKTGFGLVLGGEPGQASAFDPDVHESSGERILTGKSVTLLRPWVQWEKGPVIRLIIRALVAPTK